MNKDGIFEIREYLDDHDVVSSHEVLDITRELEYMEHLQNQVDISDSANNLNEDDEFIRELSIISDEHLTLTISSNSELVDRLGKFEISENTIKENSNIQKPLNWTKGFLNKANKLNQRKLVTKDTIISNNSNDVVQVVSNIVLDDKEDSKVKDIHLAFNGNIFERLAPSI